MRKLYSLLLLTAALICLPWSVKAATTVFSEGFEGDLSNWTKLSCHSSTGIGTEAKYSGSKGFLFNYNTNPPQYLISKELSVPNGASNLSLTFYYKAYSGTYPETFKVGYSTTTNDVTGDGVFTWDAEVSTSETKTTWTQYSNATNTFTIPAGVKYITIAYTASNQYKLYIDDIELTCNVSGPNMAVLDGETALTSGHSHNFGLATAGTTKVFTLKNDGTEPTPVAVAHTGDFGVELSAASIPAGESITLTVTMPATSGSDEITISSTSEAIADFVINVSGTVRDASKFFETLLGGSLPTDWTTSGGTWSWSTTNGASNTAWYESDNYRLITPKLAVAEGEKFFFEAQGTYSGYQGVKLEYSADGTTWTASATATAVTTDWQTFEVSDIPAGNYYIALHGWHVNIRNFYGGTPVALVKNVAAADITASGATISWTKHGSEDAWQVSYSTTSGNPDNGTIVNATSESMVLSDLNPTTTYYVSVRIGSNGEWSKEISFTTKCAAVDGIGFTQDFEDETAGSGKLPDCWKNIGGNYPYVYSSAYYARSSSKSLYYYGGTSSSEQIAILPPFSNTGDLYVTFWYSNYSSTYTGASYASPQVGYMTDPADASTFESVKTLDKVASYTQAEVSMAGAPAGSYVAIRYGDGSSSGILCVDDIEIKAIPSCAKPTDLQATNVLYNSATLSWTAGDAEEAWNLRYKAGEAEWDTIVVNTTSKNLTDLTTGTTYTAQVQADCEGDWSNEVTFTPQCKTPTGLKLDSKTTTTATISWTVNSGETEWNVQYKANADANWTTVEGVTANPYTIEGLTAGTIYQVKVAATCNGTYTSSIEFPTECAAKKLTFNEDFSTLTCWTMAECNSNTGLNDGAFRFRWESTPQYLISPELEASEKKVIVTFEYKVYSASYPESFVVGYSTTNNEIASFTWGTEKTDCKNTSYETYSETLPEGVKFVAIKCTSENQYYLYIDNFSVAEVPSCFKPTALAATTLPDGASFAWGASDGGEETQYQYACVATGETPNEWTLLDANVREVTLHALVPGTTYDFYVRSYCTSEDQSEAVKVSFAPVCNAPTNVKVGSLTSTGATASWTAAANIINYQYVVVAAGAEVDWTAETVKTTAETSVELTALEAQTSYDFYVRSYFSETIFNAAAKVNFTTECNASTLPYETSFEDDEANAAPACWKTARKDANFNLPVVSTSLHYGEEGTKSLYFYGGGSTSNAIAVLPKFAKDIKKLQISFYYKNSTTNRAKFGVGYIADPKDVTTYSQLKELIRTTSWTNTGEIDLSEATAGSYIAICFYGGSDNSYGNVDSVIVSELPTCKAPKNLAASTLYNGATLTWTAGNEETAWVVEYSTFSDFSEVTAEDVETTPSIELTGLTTGTKYYARVKASCEENEFSAYSDVVEFTPNYVAPTDVTISEITTTGAKVTWTANSGEAAWTLQYRLYGAITWNDVAVTVNPYTLNGLNAGKNYEVRVLAGTIASEAKTFATECIVITSEDLPWNEDFASTASGQMPNCWQTLDVPTSGYPEIHVANTDPLSLFFRSSDKTGFAILPEFNIDFTKVQASFTYEVENKDNCTLVFGYLTDATDAATFQPLRECQPTANWNWKEEQAIKLTTVPENARLAFKYTGALPYYYDAYVSNVLIEAIPACAIPTGLAASELTTTSAKLAWTSEASAWKVEYSKNSDFSSSTIVNANAKPFVLEGLTESTRYYVRVAAVCGENNESEYSDAISFTTECELKAVSKENPWRENFGDATVDELPFCWDVVGNVNYTSVKVTEEGVETTKALKLSSERTSNNSYDVIAIMPEFSVEIDLLQIDFQYENGNAGSIYGQLQVGYYLSGTFTAIASLERVADAFAAASVELTGAPEGARMAIKLAAGTQKSVTTAIVDNIVVSFHPTCYTPKNFEAVATADGASLTWTAGKAEEEWNIRYKATADDSWKTVDNITTASYTLTGLVEDVEYEAQVRAYCSESDQSEWSASVTFTPLGETTGIGNVDAAAKVVKLIENNQLVIIIDGVRYNAQGQVVK